jgi:hypothetical protein
VPAAGSGGGEEAGGVGKGSVMSAGHSDPHFLAGARVCEGRGINEPAVVFCCVADE